MALKKCPRCELNYILDGGKYCTVCRREMNGEKETDNTYDLCSVCNENPALPGKDICFFCLQEMKKDAETDPEEQQEPPLEINDTGEMEEIAIDVDEDIPDHELGEIDRELSLDDVLEKENEGDKDEEDDKQEDM